MSNWIRLSGLSNIILLLFSPLSSSFGFSHWKSFQSYGKEIWPNFERFFSGRQPVLGIHELCRFTILNWVQHFFWDDLTSLFTLYHLWVGSGYPLTVQSIWMSVPSKTVTSLGPWSSSAGMPVTLSVPESVSLPVSVAATQVYTPKK